MLCVRVRACVDACVCVVSDLCKYGVYTVVEDKENNVTICTFFLNRALVSPVSVGQSCVDANTIAKPQLMGLCLLHILDRKKKGHLFSFLFFLNCFK